MFSPDVFTSVINSYFPEPQASLLNGILFGVSLKTTKVFYQQLKAVGLLHIVVLSGINITLLAAIVTSVTSSLGRSASIVLTITTIILFVLFVGPQAPIIRAAFMGGLTLVAILYGRKNIVLYALFLSAVFIAIFWPRWISSVSFQLSYGATLGIILFGTVKGEKGRGLFEEIKDSVWRELKPSLAAQIFTGPIIFFYFGQISLIAPLSNILVAPIIAPLMVFGFLAAVLGKLNFWLGLIPAYICHGLLSYIVFTVETLSKLPFSFVQF